jgi:integral membrane protein
MYFKHLAGTTEIGVKIFGPLHGGIFMAFLVAALLVGIARKWSLLTWACALLGSIVPLGSVIFVIWADRTGRIDARTVAANRGEDMPNLVA